MFRSDQKDYIVSLYDFTPEADVALSHATKIAGQTGNEVRLLHVLNKQTPSKLRLIGKQSDELEQTIQEVVRKNQDENNVPTSYEVIKGNLFDEIPQYIATLEAALMVLGTPGVKGLQHILGADSKRVILSSPVPVIVAQKQKANYHGYKNILIPIDYSTHGKNKLDAAVTIARYFKSEINFIQSTVKDEYLSSIVAQNLSYAKFLMKVHQLPHTIHYEDQTENSFSRQIIDLAIEKSIDLIIISSEHHNQSIRDLFFGINETSIINNEAEIAVMCVNPLQEDIVDD